MSTSTANGSRPLAGAGAAALLALALAAPPAAANEGLGQVYVENWILFQRNVDGTNQWQYDPHFYIPWNFENGWTFTQRIDFPLLDTNATGPGKPEPGYSGGVGDAYIEEIFDSPDVAPNFRWRASVRFVFPTGKPKPFGNSQYQWGPGLGFEWRLPDAGDGVVLRPFARYLSGFAPQQPDVSEIRKLELYPAADFALGDGWSVLFYPQNPIVYNEAKGTWFVPIDVLLSRKLDRALDLGIGGAYGFGSSSSAEYRFIIDARITYRFQ